MCVAVIVVVVCMRASVWQLWSWAACGGRRATSHPIPPVGGDGGYKDQPEEQQQCVGGQAVAPGTVQSQLCVGLGERECVQEHIYAWWSCWGAKLVRGSLHVAAPHHTYSGA